MFSRAGRVHAARLITAIFAGTALFFVLAASSPADPGTPGVSDAARSVYVGSEEDTGRPDLAAGIRGETERGETDPGQPLSAREGGPSPAEPSVATGLPFTGLLAPIGLVAGLIALALGFGLRLLTQPRRS
jgi:hypothetical protein